MEDEDPEHVVRLVREQFVGGFSARCDRLAAFIDRDAFEPLVADTHRMAGLAGTLGLPSVSERAREFEDQLRDAGRLDVAAARQRLDALRHAIAVDLERAVPFGGNEENSG